MLDHHNNGDDGNRTRNPLAINRAEQLKSYCWEGLEFIQLVYCMMGLELSIPWL